MGLLLTPRGLISPYGDAVVQRSAIENRLTDWFLVTPEVRAGLGSTWRNLRRIGADGTLYQSPAITTDALRPGGYGALSFTGVSNQCVQFPRNTQFGFYSLLVTFWVRRTGAGAFNAYYVVLYRTGFSARFGITSEVNPARIEAGFSGLSYTLTMANALPTNEWAHVGIFIDQSNIYAYFNGVFDSSTAVSSGFNYNAADANWTVGGLGPATATLSPNADIDDVRILLNTSHAYVPQIMRASMAGYPDDLAVPIPFYFAAAAPGGGFFARHYYDQLLVKGHV